MSAVLVAPFGHAAQAQDAIDRPDTKAHEALNAGDYDQAIDYWTRVIKLDPKDATAYFNRADAHEKKNEHDKALADYAMSIRLKPGDPAAYEHRAKIYVDKATRLDRIAEDNDDVGVNEGIHPEAKPDWDKAIADYSAAFEIRIKSEADPRAWLEKKSDYWSQETNPAIGAACYRKITKLHPKDAGAWSSLGAAERTVDDRRRAIADYTEAIRLDPKNAETYKQRAYVRGQWPEGRKKEAADYTESLRLKPDESTYMQRAPVYDILGEYDKAIADYGEAIRLGEGFLGYVQRAGLYARMHEWDKAIADYTTILKTHSPSDILHQPRGDLLQPGGDLLPLEGLGPCDLGHGQGAASGREARERAG